jgi:hypothetical protein
MHLSTSPNYYEEIFLEMRKDRIIFNMELTAKDLLAKTGKEGS